MRQFITLVTVLSFFFASCQSKGALSPVQQLNLNIPSDPATLDPRKGGDLVSSMLHFLLFEGLVRLNEEGVAIPSLAERIELSEDRKIYTFHLRDTQWSNGSPMRALDVEKSWKDILAPDFPAANAHLLYPVLNGQAYKMGEVGRDEVGIRAINDNTLEVTLIRPTPYFLELIAFCVCFPVNAELDRTNPDWEQETGEQFVCSGPFTLAKWKHNNEILLVKNPHFWGKDSVRLEAIKISMVNDEMTALQMFEKGEIDILGNPLAALPSDAVPELKRQGRLQIRPVAASTFCCFNLNQPPFNNVNIRKAFAYAIDREQIVNNITQLSEVPALSMIPPVLKKGKKDLFFQDADAEKARFHFKKGLEELGLTRKDFPHITYRYTSTALQKKVSQALQQQWQRVLGIQIELEGCDHKVMMQMLKMGNYSMAQASWMAQYHDPMNIFERFQYADNVKNYSNWENEEYVRLLNLSSQAETEEKRTAIFQQAEEVFLQEMPIAPIFHWNSVFMAHDYVKRFDLAPIGDGFFERAYIDTEAKGVWR